MYCGKTLDFHGGAGGSGSGDGSEGSFDTLALAVSALQAVGVGRASATVKGATANEAGVYLRSRDGVIQSVLFDFSELNNAKATITAENAGTAPVYGSGVLAFAADATRRYYTFGSADGLGGFNASSAMVKAGVATTVDALPTLGDGVLVGLRSESSGELGLAGWAWSATSGTDRWKNADMRGTPGVDEVLTPVAGLGLTAALLVDHDAYSMWGRTTSVANGMMGGGASQPFVGTGIPFLAGSIAASVTRLPQISDLEICVSVRGATQALSWLEFTTSDLDMS